MENNCNCDNLHLKQSSYMQTAIIDAPIHELCSYGYFNVLLMLKIFPVQVAIQGLLLSTVQDVGGVPGEN